ncbi:MAG: tRNA 4-thiouridine(8) synthase ThiI [Candidatus Coatesbacteria bacterium]|nr:tRNA 4-thiouridine(8) synthase ThiI [Candidatus Coatesbacteria bacterium]
MKYNALVLMSGGADSLLAARLLLEQDINITAISFYSPFFSSDEAERLAGFLSIPFLSMDLTNEMIEIIKNPRYGLGSGANPCIDCHGLMLRKSVFLMKELNAHFIATGEVVGQRPMSQQKNSLNLIAKMSGAKELVLRPLFAKIMKPTLPELKGWIDRSKLERISGRGRKRQVELIEKFGYQNETALYSSGGCLLTDKTIGRRVKDLVKHDQLNERNAKLLTIGRHFRISERLKIILTRREDEDAMIKKIITENSLEPTDDYSGPTAAIITEDILSEEDVNIAANLIASYTKYENDTEILIDFNGKIIRTKKIPKKNFSRWLI